MTPHPSPTGTPLSSVINLFRAKSTKCHAQDLTKQTLVCGEECRACNKNIKPDVPPLTAQHSDNLGQWQWRKNNQVSHSHFGLFT